MKNTWTVLWTRSQSPQCCNWEMQIIPRVTKFDDEWSKTQDGSLPAVVSYVGIRYLWYGPVQPDRQPPYNRFGILPPMPFLGETNCSHYPSSRRVVPLILKQISLELDSSNEMGLERLLWSCQHGYIYNHTHLAYYVGTSKHHGHTVLVWTHSRAGILQNTA